MKALVSWAYGVDARLIAGPDWVMQGEDRFAIEAVMPEGSARDNIPEMLRSLLAEGFHLLAHRVAGEQSAYALVAKKGPKLSEPHDMDESACKDAEWQDGLDGTASVCRMTQVVGDHSVSTILYKSTAYGPNL